MNFYAPFDPGTLYPASVLIRHIARCNALELPHTTPPSAVAHSDVVAPPVDVAELFEWIPPVYRTLDRGIDPYVEIKGPSGRFDQIFVAGGRMGGKSHGVMSAAIDYSSRHRQRVALVRKVALRLKDGALKLAKDHIAKSEFAADWTVSETVVRNNKTGSTVAQVEINESTAHGAASAARGLEGIDIATVEEASFLHAVSLQNIVPTILRTPGARIVYALNPGEVPSPVEELYLDGVPDRALVAYRSSEMNPYLFLGPGAQEVLNAHRRMTIDKFRHVYRGAGLERSELACLPDGFKVGYLDWKAFNDSDLDRVETRFGMDFSLSVGSEQADPNACVRVHYIPAKMRPDYTRPGSVKPILYWAAEAVGKNVGTNQLHTLPEAVGAKEGDTVFCDSQSILIDAMNQSGMVNAVQADKGPGSIMAGLSRIGSCDLLVSPECPTVQDELTHLKWETDRTGRVKRPLRPDPACDDHTVDAGRYALTGLVMDPGDSVVML